MAGREAATIEAIDPASGTDDDLDAIHAIQQTIAMETGAEASPEPTGAWRARVRATAHGERASRFWLACDPTGNPIGCAAFHWSRSDPARRVSGFGLDVLPPARRRGVGTQLLAAVLDAAAERDKAFVQTWTVTGGLGEPFLSAFAGTLGSVARLADLHIAAVDRALLERWVARARLRASDYSLLEWDGIVPQEWRAELVRVMFVMNTAPSDELVVDERRPTVEEIEEAERIGAAEGWDTRFIAARHDPSGTLVGYTELSIPPGVDVARQGDTVVEVAHRNRGIGRWVKARMLLRLMDERPDVLRVRTDNAASNAPMLAINDALGFRTIRSNGIWQVPVEAAQRIARERLRERPAPL